MRARTRGGRAVVGITGAVAAGKSTLARRLSACVVSTDHYLPDYDRTPEHLRDLPESSDLARLAQDLGIDVTDAELNASIVQMARQRGTRPDQVRAELQQSGRLNEMALAIREAKTLDRVLAKAKVTDISAEDWNKVVTEKQKAALARTNPKKKG